MYTLHDTVVHSVVNEGAQHTAALHVYVGDLRRVARHIWRHDSTDK